MEKCYGRHIRLKGKQALKTRIKVQHERGYQLDSSCCPGAYNILANADYSSVLLSDCPNYAYHTFMEIYTNAFNQACPENPLKRQKDILNANHGLQMVY